MMKAGILFVLAFFFCISCAEPILDKSFIAEIALKAETWTPGINENFVGWDESEVKSLLGWDPEIHDRLPDSVPLIPLDLPENFNASSKWPHCKTIGTIYNQARCGSCWAFGGVEAASDRFCIASGGKVNEIMSFGQVTECDDYSNGCDGGSAGATWNFIQNNGIVSDACYPYYIPTCAPSQQPCLNFVDTPYCWSNNSCVNGDSWNLHHMENIYGINSVEEAMQQIYQNGPIEACFEVYSDFVHYKSGVYIHKSGDFLGGHCVKISGWGVENGVKYWLVNNSWTTYWGDKGYFKIERGVDMCGIEDSLVAGDPSRKSLSINRRR